MGVIPVAHAVDIPSSVTILQPTCGLDIVSGSPINYGSLNIGQTSQHKEVKAENTGNAVADVAARGTDWQPANGDDVMNVGATHYAGATFAYESMNVLTDTDEVIGGNFPPGTELTTYWQLRVDLIAGQESFEGEAEQTVTFTGIC